MYVCKVNGGPWRHSAMDLLRPTCFHPRPLLSHQPRVWSPGSRNSWIPPRLRRLLGCSVHLCRFSIRSLDSVRGQPSEVWSSRLEQLVQRHQTVPDGQCRHRRSNTSVYRSCCGLCRLLDAVHRVPTRRSTRLYTVKQGSWQFAAYWYCYSPGVTTDRSVGRFTTAGHLLVQVPTTTRMSQ